MSKKQTKGRMSEVGWGYGYAVAEDCPNRIIGNVLTLVELLGLPDKQEKPFKDLIHQRIWECFNDGILLKPETHTTLRENHAGMMSEARVANLPPNAI